MIKGELKLGDRLKTKHFGNRVRYMVCQINGTYSLILIKDETTWGNIGTITSQPSLRGVNSLFMLTKAVNQHFFRFIRVH